MHKSVNIKDVAQLAQVSTATVSRYLHGQLNRMAPTTAQKVAAAIEKLNYVPNAAAQQLITNRSKTIAVVVANAADSFSTAIFKGACSVLEAADYIPVMLDTNSDQNTENKLINAVGLGTYDGLILQPLSSDVPTIQAEVRRQMPIVTLDRQLDYSPWPQVIINNFTSSQKAAQYFKSEHYQQILILSASVAIASTRQERLQGIKSIYPQAALIEIDERHIEHEQVQHQIISFLQKQHQKTVLFSLKERWLLEFLPALISLGILQNKNIQISGFADTLLVSAIWPSAKMIQQNPFSMGQIAGKRLLQILNKDSSIQPLTVIPTTF
ncbi:LacI family DNA-binding transcriptional regulator [Bombilactobacillus bombi]|uniref:LacI family DNA-binding transcriptional regulator n=1 Tax=Bombilactobacillus bombi TaxID=1303590 RepID=UPI0015E5CD2A|nr:LacI family DNA-binding transcriptional regulator [Bombilactobacillus bombi]MBA1434058.1 LacI family transcriptional regulator [Bombilactobacillus bombi]